MNVDQLGTIAAKVAMRAAAEYVRVNDLKVLDYEAATACLKTWCKIKLPQALADAKAAIECNMHQIAEATFKATMAEAGIEAAKEFAWPADYEPA
ncbi:MAG: hypothetical protein H8E44_04340 [Planctomycetes bacterium]|nr:hypothetical protein [Planctomycetota bacterium]